MVELFDIAVALFALPGSLWLGYRTLRTVRLSRILSGTESDTTVALSTGESTAIEGEVIVDEPAMEADRATNGTESPVGMYLWRARFPRSGSNYYDFDEGEWKQRMATFASGIECGTVTVSDGRQRVRVDLEWLIETHESPALDTVAVDGVIKNDTFSTYLWDSPYLHLSGETYETSLDRLRGVISYNTDVDLTTHSFESRAVPEGTVLTVHGELHIDQGEPVIRGTDETPLLVSDRGFDAHRSTLRIQSIKNGVFSLLLLAIVLVLFLY